MPRHTSAFAGGMHTIQPIEAAKPGAPPPSRPRSSYRVLSLAAAAGERALIGRSGRRAAAGVASVVAARSGSGDLPYPCWYMEAPCPIMTADPAGPAVLAAPIMYPPDPI
mmetsp:Transcript_12194/g.17979  ORF Transcript_12194/g.17979 Transcript_12194/m.17979 type:complete len:110 (+) Transcript_12194:344-673(+)